MTESARATQIKSGTASVSEPGYRVGKGRPPREHCFQKGVSGNPRGRPKGSKNLATIMNRILNTRIDTVRNGKPAKVTVKEAAGLKLAKKALDGDFRSIAELLRFAELLDQDAVVNASRNPADDAELVRIFAERVQSGAFDPEKGRPEQDRPEQDRPEQNAASSEEAPPEGEQS